MLRVISDQKKDRGNIMKTYKEKILRDLGVLHSDVESLTPDGIAAEIKRIKEYMMKNIPEGDDILQGEELELIIHGKAEIRNIERAKPMNMTTTVSVLAYGYIYHCDGPMPDENRPYRLSVYDR